MILHRRYAPYEPTLRRSRAYARCRSRTRPRSTGASPTCAASTRLVRGATASARDPRRCSTSTWPARHGHRGRNRDRARAGRRHVRAAAGGPRAAVLARRLGREVRRAQRGGVEARPARRRPEGRRAREAAVRAGRNVDRPAVLAPARRRRGRLARSRSSRSTPRRRPTPRVLERGRRALRRAGREARVRLAAEPLARDVALRHRITRASSATPSSTGSPAASARRRARSGSRTTSPARARPRA